MFQKESYLKKIAIAVWIFVSFLGFYLLYIGQFIFVPLTISLFLLVLFSGVYNFFHRYITSHVLSIIVTAGVFILFFGLVGYIIVTQVGSFAANSGKFQEGFSNMLTQINTFSSTYLGTDLKQYLNLEYLKQFADKINYGQIGKSFFGTISNIFGFIATTFIILIFIFLERKSFKKKGEYIFDVKGVKKMNNIYQKIYNDLNIYFSSKFFIALFNGVVATIIMMIFGLDFALTFGLLVFIFDFVPLIGGLIALGLPFLYSLVTFGSLPISIGMLVALNIPQWITGNIVEPRIMGNRLNLSTLVLTIALLFWASFWGIIGAFLATPIMATINIILARFEATKPIAILLSKNGKVN